MLPTAISAFLICQSALTPVIGEEGREPDDARRRAESQVHGAGFGGWVRGGNHVLAKFGALGSSVGRPLSPSVFSTVPFQPLTCSALFLQVGPKQANYSASRGCMVH